ncbi:MAG: proprotein convertase P-domain-containing protein [Thiolinea sp.]
MLIFSSINVVQAASFSYENTAVTAIPDNACPSYTAVNIAVPDNFTIDDLNVGLNITHTYRSDLNVKLKSPAGTSVSLFAGVSGSADNLDALLDDGAATDISSLGPTSHHNVGSPYYDNLVNPAGNVYLAAFNGENAQGNWTLEVCDSAGSDIGAVNRVKLDFSGTPPALSCMGYADSVTALTTIALNTDKALGAPEIDGTAATDSNSARINNSNPVLSLETPELLAAGTEVTIALGRTNSNGNVNIDMSANGVLWTPVTSFNAGLTNVLGWLKVNVPAGGARYIRFTRTGGGMWIGGLQYPKSSCAAPTAFSCPSAFYQMYSNDDLASNVVELTFGATPATNLLTTYPEVLNAAGYNPVDNYLYALVAKNANINHLIRIGSNGTAQDLGLVSGLPEKMVSGDFDAAGNFYVKMADAQSSNLLFKVNIATRSATQITLNNTIAAQDFSYSPLNGKLYAIDNPLGLLEYSSSGSSGTVNSYPLGGISISWGAGATFYSNGYLFGYNNGSGQIAKVNLASKKVVQMVSALAGLSSNDGASCPSAPPPFASLFAVADAASTDQVTPVVIDVLNNDSAHLTSVDPTTVQITQAPSTGSTSIDAATGAVTYTPTTTGTYTFAYEVCDSVARAICDEAVVTVDVSNAGGVPACTANLVDSYFYNPDFEAYSSLPTDWSYPGSSQLDRLNNWDQTTRAPVIFCMTRALTISCTTGATQQAVHCPSQALFFHCSGRRRSAF